MKIYLIIGAIIWIIVGKIIPPGCIFWFFFGACSGFVAHRYGKGKFLN